LVGTASSSWSLEMRVLVVGGSGFLGSAIVAEAVGVGHEVTAFTRGRTKSLLPRSSVTHLEGNRYTDLSALRGKAYDLVVDTCAFTPLAVNLLMDALSPEIGRYALVSSGSVYADCSEPGIAEDAPTPHATEAQIRIADAVPLDERSSAMAYDDYGPLKRSAEIAASERLGSRAFILRAGLLVGAGDYTDRLTYWLRRVDQGGVMVAPGDPRRFVQYVDVADAARFIIGGALRGLTGAFNLTGVPVPMGFLLDACRAVAQSDAELRWLPDDALLAAGIAPWTDLPLWIPEQDTMFRHFLAVSTAKALNNGLHTRPLEETLASILAWDRGRRHLPLKVGLSAEKEQMLLSRL
jgi:2'-hydroxyisoflavone reductase